MKYIFVSAVILVLGILGFLNPLRLVFHVIFNPVQFNLVKSADEIRNADNFLVNIGRIYQDNLNLRNENEALKSYIVDLKKNEDENSILRNQLGIKDKFGNDRTLVLADVMGNSQDLSGTTVYIDKGSQENIGVGDNVIIGNDLIGLVKIVENQRSIVELVTSPNISITVYDIDTPKKTEGLAVGLYGTSIEMRRILPGEEIKVGDTILSSGRDGIVQPGLVVGKVTNVNQVQVEPLKSAYLETPIDINSLKNVFVVVKK